LNPVQRRKKSKAETAFSRDLKILQTGFFLNISKFPTGQKAGNRLFSCQSRFKIVKYTYIIEFIHFLS
jgi:hypothetical protein